MAFQCVRCGKTDQRLTEWPMGGALGQEIVTKICAPCWTEWDAMQVKVINEYRLDLSRREHYDMVLQAMRNFLQLDGATGAAPHVGTPTHGPGAGQKPEG